MASLKEYHRKRNFQSTPEPKGDEKRDTRRSVKAKARLLCVQKHLASSLHYDFRLEHNGVLLSWAVPKGPSLNPKDRRLAMHVEDHPLDYGGFEGVIPEGYGAGIVMLWDKGTWTPEPGFEDVDAAMKKGELKFSLSGVKLKGSWVIVRIRNDDRTWLLIKHRDDWAGAVDVTKVAPKSVKSDKDFAEILASDKPAIWESHEPTKGGAAGKMLRQIIAQAAELKAKKSVTKKKSAKTAKSTKRKRVRAA